MMWQILITTTEQISTYSDKKYLLINNQEIKQDRINKFSNTKNKYS